MVEPVTDTPSGKPLSPPNSVPAENAFTPSANGIARPASPTVISSASAGSSQASTVAVTAIDPMSATLRTRRSSRISRNIRKVSPSTTAAAARPSERMRDQQEEDREHGGVEQALDRPDPDQV